MRRKIDFRMSNVHFQINSKQLWTKTMHLPELVIQSWKNKRAFYNQSSLHPFTHPNETICATAGHVIAVGVKGAAPYCIVMSVRYGLFANPIITIKMVKANRAVVAAGNQTLKTQVKSKAKMIQWREYNNTSSLGCHRTNFTSALWFCRIETTSHSSSST